MKTLYKFLNLDNNGKLRSHYGKHEWTVGTEYEVSGEIELCSNGFHASERIIDAIGYVHGNILAIVEGSGDYISRDNKVAWKKMRVLRAYHWTPEDSVALAIVAAKFVLPIYESWAPDDDRPRQAIEAARSALAAARADAATAGGAADAARGAADAARAASRAASRAADAADTYAARGAADAAVDAAGAASRAADAAAYAVRAAARAAADAYAAARAAADAADDAAAAAVTYAGYGAAYCASAKADISAYAAATGTAADAARSALNAKIEEWLVQHAATLRPYTPTKECR